MPISDERREYMQAWYRANKERVRELRARWKKEHPETLRAMRKRYRQKHKLGLAMKTKAWRKANPEAYAAIQKRHEQKRGFWRRYLLTLEQYNAMLTAQGGGCAICGVAEPGSGKKHFAVDHDHACCGGKRSCGNCTRALLCMSCNLAIGYFKDSPDLAYTAALYLREHKRRLFKKAA